jgi:two-component system LytT family sensor kinase
MIFAEYVNANNKKVFTVSARVIWFSALFMGVLASIPKILQLHITAAELIADSSIAFLYSLFVWYYNIYSLPRYSSQHITTRFFSRRLLWSILLGIGLMMVLISCHQLLYPHYKFRSMMLMYQFRGILINLTIYMFLYLLYQSHATQLMGIELERTKADNLGAQYELLKQQVNPHFLFNSLNTLKSMVEIGDQHSADFIVKLSDFYRFTLENRRQDVIPLVEELDILNAYVYLLKARFEDGIELDVNLDLKHQSTSIPPFTLQLLVENCIKHNVVSLEQPLSIKLYSDGDYIVLENKLQPKKTPEPSTQMGLENINQRYLHLIGKKIEVAADDRSFKVKLPVIYEYRNN